MQSSNI